MKVVVIPVEQQPKLIFVAKEDIDVGDELLFDYNDRQSTMPFLKSCPVCSHMSQPSQSTEPSQMPADQPQPTTSQPQPSTSSAEQSQKRKRGKTEKGQKVKRTKTVNDEITELAGREDLGKEQRQRLFDAVEERFPAHIAVTRSTLEGFIPGMSEANIHYLLMRRNTEAANAMCRRMQKGSSARQQSILDSLMKE